MLRSTQALALQGRHANKLVATLSVSLVYLASYQQLACQQRDVALAVYQPVVQLEQCLFLAVYLGAYFLKQLAANNKVVVASIIEDKVYRDLAAIKYQVCLKVLINLPIQSAVEAS